MAKNYYDLLGVKKDASAEEIKRAFRQKAMQYHPDKNKGSASAEKKFKELNEAYEILKDPKKRAAYDHYGESFQNGGAGGGYQENGFNPGNFDFGEFGDIFNEFFNGVQKNAYREEIRGSDVKYEATLTLEEAFTGKALGVRMNIYSGCGTCRGNGSEDGKIKQCPACKGTGKMRFAQGLFALQGTCTSCNGLGKIIQNPCKKCSGSGRYQRIKTIQVAVPPGVDTGTRLRVAGEGEAGIRGGASGDLFVFITVKKHPFFERDGNNLICTVPILMVTAALGGEIQVPTIDGKKVSVKIPEGTHSGQQLKLRNQGMPALDGSGRGHMIVNIKVLTPTNLSDKQKKLLKEFEESYKPSQYEGFFAKVREFWKNVEG